MILGSRNPLCEKSALFDEIKNFSASLQIQKIEIAKAPSPSHLTYADLRLITSLLVTASTFQEIPSSFPLRA